MSDISQPPGTKRSTTALSLPEVNRQLIPEASLPMELSHPSASSSNLSAMGDKASGHWSRSGLLEEPRVDDVPPSKSTLELARGVDADISYHRPVRPFSAHDSTASHPEAMEVLQIIRNLGFTVQKKEEITSIDPASRTNTTIKRQGTLVTCEVCHKFQGLPSQLR